MKAISILAAFSLLALACSSDDTTTTDAGTTDTGTTSDTGVLPTDAGTPTDSGPAADAAPSVDAGAPNGPVLNGCSQYVDRTADAASRTLVWSFSIANAPERCITIKAGQTVIFQGDHTVHPLAAKGGDATTPITNVADVKFATAGTFGYVCSNHPSMTGVVYVLP
jgi:plastocyanin